MVGLRLRPATSCQREDSAWISAANRLLMSISLQTLSKKLLRQLGSIYAIYMDYLAIRMTLKMASNDLKGQNFSCKFLLSQSIVIVDQDGVFFCGQQNGFVVASVVILEVHSHLLIRSLLSPNWTRRLLQNVRLGSLGISDLDYRCSINRLVLSWSFYWMSSFPIYSPDNLGNLSVLGKSLINAVKV